MIDSSYYARGQIWYRNDDRDEEGRGILKKARPVIIVSNNIGIHFSSVAIVVPLTTARRSPQLDTQVKLMVKSRDNWALCEQLYCTSIDKLGTYVGTVSTTKMKEIDRALKITLANDDELADFESSGPTLNPADKDDVNVDSSDVAACMPAVFTQSNSENSNVTLEHTKPKLECSWVEEAVKEFHSETHNSSITADNKQQSTHSQSHHKERGNRFSLEKRKAIIDAFERGRTSGVGTRQKLLDEFGYSSWNGLANAARRFKKLIEEGN